MPAAIFSIITAVCGSEIWLTLLALAAAVSVAAATAVARKEDARLQGWEGEWAWEGLWEEMWSEIWERIRRGEQPAGHLVWMRPPFQLQEK